MYCVSEPEMVHRAIDVNGQRGLPLKKDIANREWGQSLKGDKFNIWPNQLIQRTR